MSVSKSFTAVDQTSSWLTKNHGALLSVSITGTFVATLVLERTSSGGLTWETIKTYTATATDSFPVSSKTQSPASYRLRCSAYTSGTAVTVLSDPTAESDVSAADQTHNDVLIGKIALPTAGNVSLVIERVSQFFTLTFTLTAARITVTDGAASGSYGALKIFDFVTGGLAFIGCRQNYTAYAEGTALTTAAGDCDFVIGVGTTAIAAAADKTLATANKNVGASLAQTNSSGTTTGRVLTASASTVDGTTSAASLYLNWSGSAATVDANSTLDVTGTITVVGCFLGTN